MASERHRRGVVTEFDAHKGWGTVTESDGSRWFFQCTRIADGSRSIEPGTAVTFRLEARLPGRYEATELLR
jgi:cold shock CspA family protein